MKRVYQDYLEDIFIAINDVAGFTNGFSFETFAADRKTVNAVIRSLEVIGEAAKQIPPHLQTQSPEIPWKYMAGMRDKLIHQYFGVDLGIVWAVVKNELPPLRAEIKLLLSKMN
ncbi:MAG: DUF86 domain-containing protein [Pseudomonadota bacterium]|nr:DUF86 domain-containing protein [Pseudomonadota bacterium]